MKTIWKFPLPVEYNALVMGWNVRFTMELPEEARILSVQLQWGAPVMWALVDPEAPKRARSMVLAATGKPFPEELVTHFIGTFQLNDGAGVLHLFEEATPAGVKEPQS